MNNPVEFKEQIQFTKGKIPTKNDPHLRHKGTTEDL